MENIPVTLTFGFTYCKDLENPDDKTLNRLEEKGFKWSAADKSLSKTMKWILKEDDLTNFMDDMFPPKNNEAMKKRLKEGKVVTEEPLSDNDSDTLTI